MSVLEQGHIYFFYRPRVETHEPESIEEIQRLYMILHPRGQDKYRMLVIGRKKLPDASEGGKHKYWGFVDRVVSNPKQLEQQALKEQHTTPPRAASGHNLRRVQPPKVDMPSWIMTGMRYQ